ncbi:MAG: efflux RND transporter periplasmic adaptor subunit [Desulfovermiculus sp.]|nr:efflux RND transporter periplasmic adaptor subunit [Desulfovermiculus sp.]
MKVSARKAIIAGAIVLGIAGALIFLSIAGDDPGNNKSQGEKRGGPSNVEVKAAQEEEIARTLERTGEVVATESVVIAAIKEGPIAYCPWREGDEVKAGEKLIEIDRQVYQAEVRQAEAALKVARAKLADLRAGTRPEEIDQAKAGVRKWQATLEEARTTYERQKRLQAQEFTSEQGVDQARERMEVARAELEDAGEKLRMLKAGPTKTEIAVQEAGVEDAEAKLELSRAHLEECLIKAPFDGVIDQVHVRRGDLATPRSPLIEMFDPDSLVIRFSVNEAHAATVQPGLTVKVRLDALSGQSFQGRISRVYPSLDDSLHTRTVEAELARARDLMPHQFARIILQLEVVENAVIVPVESVQEMSDGSKVVFVVEDGKAFQRSIEVGIEQEQRVQVVKGIEPGEQVVVAGSDGLKDGSPVRITNSGEESRGSKSNSEQDVTGDRQ